MKPCRRRGFSLMEVLLASGILMACLIVLGQLAVVGRQHAEDAESLTAAQMLCLAELNAMLCDAAPVASRAATPLPDAPGWLCEVAVLPRERLGLVSVQVTVWPEPAETGRRRRGKSFSLVRWMYEPAVAASSSGFEPQAGSGQGGDPSLLDPAAGDWP